jgi:Uncharacterized conserved protein
MCGRFTLILDIESVARALNVTVPATLTVQPRYNIAPSQDIVTLIHEKETAPTHLALLHWGLIPSWSKDASIGNRMINARAESLAEKPSFKRLLTARRCLIVADGFYEWKSEPGSKYKTPMYITLTNNEPFTFAGLWDSWHNPNGEQVQSCTIITTQPNDVMSSIHNRMPVILPTAAREEWLAPQNHDTATLLSLLTPYTNSAMQARPVSRLVNNVNNDSAEVLQAS